MKKKEFDGIDFAVVEKFKVPIEKFNTNEDLQNWAKNKFKEIADKDFGGRQEETKIQRKAMLKEWSDYVLKENDAYNNAVALLILNAVTKDLKPDNDKLPPVLNKGVLADCISEIDMNLKSDKKYQFDLNKMYETKLRALYFEDNQTENGNTGWVIIPSEKHAPENFEENVEKLKTLSHKNWCTKSFNAQPYLSKGDFHVYLENGQPKLGVRFVDDEIQEIQGEQNNGKIPQKYLATAEEHISSDKLELSYSAQSEIYAARTLKKDLERIKQELADAIKDNDVEKILEYWGIKVECKDKNGYLTISKYTQPSECYTFEDIGINERKLFEKIKHISGLADFRGSQIIDLGNLNKIDGSAFFRGSQVRDLGNLSKIGGDADFRESQIRDLGNLSKIGGNAYFSDSLLKSEDFKNITIGCEMYA